MASFKDLRLKSAYDSDEDDVLGDFYIPALAKSVRYDRLAGFFSSSTLAAAAKGMADFIENDGKMRLVTSVEISEEDKRAMEDGTSKPQKAIADAFLKELEMADNLQRDHVAALAWMISQGNLDIKIAIPDKNSLYHQKVGILYDGKNQRITFSGSINESRKAWKENIEEFKVFCDWKQGQEAYGDTDSKTFEKFWSGRAKNTRVVDLPTAVRDYLRNMAPSTKKEAVDNIREFTLYPHQREAVYEWCENGYRGMLNMATGTGKTKTAVACIDEILKLHENEPCLVVIACPTMHLIDQWDCEFKNKRYNVKKASSRTNWRKNLDEMSYNLSNNIIKNLIIITTHNTFSGEKFVELIKKFKAKSMVIVDEAHGAGAEKTSRGLLNEYEYRLGLSATPKRYFDDDGTDIVYKYFDREVFEFSLDKAIKHGYLARYKFFPRVAHLTNKEMSKYLKVSRLIAIEKNKPTPDVKKIEGLQFNRSRIIKSAVNKIKVLKDILEEMGQIDHCLIYCADTRQIQKTFPILNKKNVFFHQFTQNESGDQRNTLLNQFTSGVYPVLLAIKCLDEGVDIPSAKTAIILASSGNPREFIQRRGRLLRPDNGKIATIYDVITLPNTIPVDLKDSERTLIVKETDRLKEFASSSENREAADKVILEIKTKYGVQS